MPVHAEEAPGRLPNGPPLAVIDIGSNSVRLVVYEGLCRSVTPIFNEKIMCGLGRSIASTGRLAEDAVERALSALCRFRKLCDAMKVGAVRVLATAAARDAANGAAFIAEAGTICRAPVELLSGRREAELAALGVVSGIHRPNGLVGDLGGGSLELVEVHDERIGTGVTLPLGGLMLQDAASNSIRKAEKLVRAAFQGVDQLARARRQSFFAVGGTWRALGRLHMAQTNYPLRVMHGYRIDAGAALAFARKVRAQPVERLPGIAAVQSERRPLLAYGALVLERIIAAAKPREVVFSAAGVREGLLYELLPEDERAEDPLVSAACELGYLHSRSPRHGDELVAWTDRFFSQAATETADQKRLRHAACHLADVGWRAHPDYRGEQSFSVVANAAFGGVDHPGRIYMALSIYYRHEGLSDESYSPQLRNLVPPELLALARLLGAVFRVAYMVSASMPGLLLRAPLVMDAGRIVLRLPPDLADLAADRLANRVRQLGRLMGADGVIEIMPS